MNINEESMGEIKVVKSKRRSKMIGDHNKNTPRRINLASGYGLIN